MTEKTVIQLLEEFLDTSVRNRKYASNTAYGIKAALKLFSQELNEDELQSFDLFKERFEQIYQTVFNNNKSKMNITTLVTYKSRLQKILGDYEKYGTDPSKMTSWNPVRRNKSSHNAQIKNLNIDLQPFDNNRNILDGETAADSNRHEVSLRPSKKIVIVYPSDFTLKEAKSIKSFGEYLVSSFDEDQT